MFVHNGVVRGIDSLRRALTLEIDQELFSEIHGTTDSELMFYLALHFGMDDDVHTGVARMVGFVEDLGRESGIEHPMQMTLGIADGERLYAFRYSSEHQSRTLYHSKSMEAVKKLVPPERREYLDEFTDDSLAIVSEPFSDLPGLWQEIPESTFLSIESGRVESRDFMPVSP